MKAIMSNQNGCLVECWGRNPGPLICQAFILLLDYGESEGVIREVPEKQMGEGGGNPLLGAQSNSYLPV